jgi:hypothetical protein
MQWRSVTGSRRGTVVAAGIAGSAGIGLALGTGSRSIGLLVGLFPIVLASILAAGQGRPGRIPAVAVAALALQPFLRLVGDTTLPAYVLQLLLCLVCVWWLARVSAEGRTAALQAARPALLAMTGVIVALVLSFGATMSFDIHTGLSLLQFAVLGVFAVMGSLAAETYDGAVRACRILLYAGLLQAPIIIGQATGWIDRVPGLGALSGAKWVAVVVGRATEFRYPGSFGSAELMAEYCAVLFLLGIGLSTMVEVGARRWWTIGVACAVFLMGWMTSTRGFILGAVAGVLAFAMFRGTRTTSRASRIGHLATLGACVAAAVLWLVPQQVTTGFVGRMLSVQTTPGSDLLNRGDMFAAWNTLLGRMPWYGFGGHYLDVVQSSFAEGVAVAPHSLYYSMLFMGGYAALLAMVALLVVVAFSALRTVRKAEEHVRALASVLLVVVIYWIVSELKIEFVRVMWYGNLVFFIFGLVGGLAGLADRRPAAAASDSGSGAGTRTPLPVRSTEGVPALRPRRSQ